MSIIDAEKGEGMGQEKSYNWSCKWKKEDC